MPSVSARLGPLPGAILASLLLFGAFVFWTHPNPWAGKPWLSQAYFFAATVAGQAFGLYIAARLLFAASVRVSKDKIEWRDLRHWEAAIDRISKVEWHRFLLVEWITLRCGGCSRDIWLFRLWAGPRRDIVHAVRALVPTALQVGWTDRFARRYGEPEACPACGYPRTGLASSRCPECGLELGAA